MQSTALSHWIFLSPSASTARGGINCSAEDLCLIDKQSMNYMFESESCFCLIREYVLIFSNVFLQSFFYFCRYTARQPIKSASSKSHFSKDSSLLLCLILVSISAGGLGFGWNTFAVMQVCMSCLLKHFVGSGSLIHFNAACWIWHSYFVPARWPWFCAENEDECCILHSFALWDSVSQSFVGRKKKLWEKKRERDRDR